MNEAADRAVALFLQMELHVADCYRCRKGEIALHKAMDGKNYALARQLATGEFCDEMGALALTFSEAVQVAFGKGSSSRT
jgi:hypothetical protein